MSTSCHFQELPNCCIETSKLTHKGHLSFLRLTWLICPRSRDKTDLDVIKENHQFLWEEDDPIDTWGKQLAKKYHDKLFKEYCICDLRKYKENKVTGFLFTLIKFTNVWLIVLF